MKTITKVLIMSLLSLVAYSQNAPAKKVDVVRLTDYLSRLPTAIKVTMSVEGIGGEKYFEFRATERVPSASVIKIPILIELMEKVKTKEIDLNKIHVLTEEEKTGGSGVFANIAAGKKFTIREVAQEMVRSSDNTATNILIKEIGMEAVNQNLVKLGTTMTRLNRVMMDTEAAKQGRDNFVNVVEVNDLLRKIYTKKVATPALCNEMLEILKNCGDRTTIPRKLPADLVIAHKTGGLPYVRGDAAIVYTSQPFILSIFVEGFTKAEDAERIIGELAEICWENLK